MTTQNFNVGDEVMATVYQKMGPRKMPTPVFGSVKSISGNTVVVTSWSGEDHKVKAKDVVK